LAKPFNSTEAVKDLHFVNGRVIAEKPTNSGVDESRKTSVLLDGV
jgi:hypothetical protein